MDCLYLRSRRFTEYIVGTRWLGSAAVGAPVYDDQGMLSPTLRRLLRGGTLISCAPAGFAIPALDNRSTQPKALELRANFQQVSDAGQNWYRGFE